MSRAARTGRPAGPPVVILTSRYPMSEAGGVERVVAGLVQGLGSGDEGWLAVNVAAFRPGSRLASIPLLGDLVAAAKLALVPLRRSDAVMIHGAEYAWGAVLAGKLVGRPTVVVWHGLRTEASLPASGSWARALLHSCFLRASQLMQRGGLEADAMVAVSPGVAGEIHRRFGAHREVTVIPNGVHADRTLRQGMTLRSAGGPLRIVWIGTTAHKKGLDLALAACALAVAAGQELTLSVVGMRSRPAHLRNLCSRPWVQWIGPLDPTELDRLLPEQELLLAPTRYEACSMAVLEAMAAGVPVIGSPIVAWQIGEGGEVSDSDDPAAYAEIIGRLADPQQRLRRGGAAQQQAQEFGWEAWIQRYRELLAQLSPAAPSSPAGELMSPTAVRRRPDAAGVGDPVGGARPASGGPS